MSDRLLRKEDAARMRPWRPAVLADVKPISAAPPAGKAPAAPSAPLSAEQSAAEARRALDQERQRARVEGYQSGYQAGQDSGAAAAAQATARLNAVADATLTAWANLEDDLASQVVDLALTIARQVLRGDPRVRRDALLDVVHESMRHITTGAHRPELHLHPADVELVRGALGDELKRGNWKLVEAHRIEPGGCRLTTDEGEIDATLPTRWRQVTAALGRDFPWSEHDET